MTAKDKALQLVDKYLLLPIDFPYTDTQDGQCIGNGFMLYNSAKQCALIAVDEILHALSYKVSSNFEEIKYYVEVKQEIEKL